MKGIYLALKINHDVDESGIYGDLVLFRVDNKSDKNAPVEIIQRFREPMIPEALKLVHAATQIEMRFLSLLECNECGLQSTGLIGDRCTQAYPAHSPQRCGGTLGEHKS